VIQRCNRLVVPKPLTKACDGHVITGCNPDNPGRQNLVVKTAWMPW
jgi:hypothetical protein